MANLDDFLKNLQKMDQKELRGLLDRAASSLTPAQAAKLKQMANNPAALEKLKNNLTAADLQKLSQNMSPDALEKMMKDQDVKKRLDDVL